MNALGVMRLTSMNILHFCRHNLSRCMVLKHSCYANDLNKANYSSKSPDPRQYNVQQVVNSIPFFDSFETFKNKTAVIDRHGSWKYKDIMQASCRLANELVSKYGPVHKQNGLNGARVGLLCDCDASLCISTFASWIANGVAVLIPVDLLNLESSENVYSALEYTDCSVVISTGMHLDDITEWTCFKNIRVHSLKTEDFLHQSDGNFTFVKANRPKFQTYEECLNRNAIIWQIRNLSRSYNYTDMALVSTFRNIMANVKSDEVRGLWKVQDTVLITPNLYPHTGGSLDLIVPLYFGAACVMHHDYSAEKVLRELLAAKGSMGDSVSRPVNKIINTCAVYSDILNIVDKDRSGQDKSMLRTACERVSTVCIMSMMNWGIIYRWYFMTGSIITVRFGTAHAEIFRFMPSRVKNEFVFVGCIKPNLMARILIYHKSGVDIVYECRGDGTVLKSEPSVHGNEGELQLKGDCVDMKWCHKDGQILIPDVISTGDGWLKTRYIAKAIDGNASISAISFKETFWLNNGQKQGTIDATLMQAILRAHPAIQEVIVFRRPNAKPNQTVGVGAVLRKGASLTLKEIHQYLNKRAQKNRINHIREHARTDMYPSVLLRLKCMPYRSKSKCRSRMVEIMIHKEWRGAYDIETIDPEPDLAN